MKLLLVSDLHYTLQQFDWVATVAEHFDVVIIAGDHLDIASPAPMEAQIVVVLNYLRQLEARCRLLVCSGNHDLNGYDTAGEKAANWMERVRGLGVPCDGETIHIAPFTITLCPWWDGPAARNTVDLQLARQANTRNGPWIWIYHAPPGDSPVSWNGKRHFGDTALNRWIQTYQPDMVLTGHIHQAPFRDGGSWNDRIGATWVFNSGRQIGPIPTHIILDTETGTANWYSMEGSESVDLCRVPAPTEVDQSLGSRSRSDPGEKSGFEG